MYQVKIEPMPDNQIADPGGLWRLVVCQYEETLTGVLLFRNVLEDNLPFKEACEITASMEPGLNDWS
jgi:hypothetical protein